MNSKDLLYTLCQHGNAQCRERNVDIDIVKCLALARGTEWYHVCLLPDSTNHILKCDVVCTIASFGAKTAWHHEAYDKYLNVIHVFNSEVCLPDEAYDVILNNMIQCECSFRTDAVDCDCIEHDINELQDEFRRNATELVLTSDVDPMYMQKARRLCDNFHKAHAALAERAHPTMYSKT